MGISNAGQAQVLALTYAMHEGLLSKLDSALVVGELVQSRAGLVGAVETVFALDAADSSNVKQFCVLLALLVGDKHWPDIFLQVQLAATVRLWALDGVYFVLCTDPEARNAATSHLSTHCALPLCLYFNNGLQLWHVLQMRPNGIGTPEMCAACTTAGSCSDGLL